VELTSGNSSKSRGGGGGRGGFGTIVRNADGLVVDGREAHLTQIVYAEASALSAEGGALTASALGNRAWDTFAETTDLRDGKWTQREAVAKARAVVRKVEAGKLALPRGETEPTYDDKRRPLQEAEAEVRGVVGAFFAEAGPAASWKAAQEAIKARRKWEADEANAFLFLQPAPDPEPVSWGVRVETAIGKTQLAIKAVAKAVKAGVRVVYAVPTHRLGAELGDRFAAEGITARVYRGYEADDPDAEDPGAKMCLDLAAWKDAQEAGVGSIKGSVCKHKAAKGETLRCAKFYDCGMTRQRQAKPDVWLVSHALLFHQRPEYIPQPDASVIDEGFSAGAIPDKPDKFPLDAMEASDLTILRSDALAMEDMSDLERAREDLERAARAS